MKNLLIILSFLTIQLLFSQENNPKIKTQVKQINDFIPKGWKPLDSVSGDLNKDGVKDIALIIENTSKLNFKKNKHLGPGTLNLNPRILLIAFKTKKGYQLKTISRKFIPSQNDDEALCLADPFLEQGNLEILNGLLKVTLNYWFSCGSWYVNKDRYTFTYQKNKFELIGFDNYSFHRATGGATDVSINYLTKKKKITSGLHQFEKSEKKVTWEKIKIENLYSLKEITTDSVLDDKQIND